MTRAQELIGEIKSRLSELEMLTSLNYRAEAPAVKRTNNQIFQMFESVEKGRKAEPENDILSSKKFGDAGLRDPTPIFSKKSSPEVVVEGIEEDDAETPDTSGEIDEAVLTYLTRHNSLVGKTPDEISKGVKKPSYLVNQRLRVLFKEQAVDKAARRPVRYVIAVNSTKTG